MLITSLPLNPIGFFPPVLSQLQPLAHPWEDLVVSSSLTGIEARNVTFHLDRSSVLSPLLGRNHLQSLSW